MLEIDKTQLLAQLNSLINRARQLQQANYTPASWSNLQARLTEAIRVRDRQESASGSANLAAGQFATWQELHEALTNLQSAIDNLVSSLTPELPKPTSSFAQSSVSKTV